MLKMAEKRQDCALSKYEGTHAQLPQVIKSYAEDMHSLQSRLRRNKSSYRKLENRHRIQSTELRVVHKDLKHLLDLTKNKQLGEREKLSNQLEEAENTIKQQEKKIQVGTYLDITLCITNITFIALYIFIFYSLRYRA